MSAADDKRYGLPKFGLSRREMQTWAENMLTGDFSKAESLLQSKQKTALSNEDQQALRRNRNRSATPTWSELLHEAELCRQVSVAYQNGKIKALDDIDARSVVHDALEKATRQISSEVGENPSYVQKWILRVLSRSPSNSLLSFVRQLRDFDVDLWQPCENCGNIREDLSDECVYCEALWPLP